MPTPLLLTRRALTSVYSIIRAPATELRSTSRSFAASTAAEPQAPTTLDPAERQIFTKLKDALAPTQVEVKDISGGCGSMYRVDVESEKFRGLSVVKQHRLVNDVLKEEVKGWHGLTLKTRAPG